MTVYFAAGQSKRQAYRENLIDVLRYVYQISSCVPEEVFERLVALVERRDNICVITDTAEWNDDYGDYVGLMMPHGASSVIEMEPKGKPDPAVGPTALMAHELVHAIGGNEYDSEIIEIAVARQKSEKWKTTEVEKAGIMAGRAAFAWPLYRRTVDNTNWIILKGWDGSRVALFPSPV